MVAQVVRQDVVAGIVQDLVFGEEVDLEAAEVGPRFQVSFLGVGMPGAVVRFVASAVVSVMASSSLSIRSMSTI
jgi:hypothetical protein